MRVGFLQFTPLRKNVTQNLIQVREQLESTQFDLLVLPELANCGYLYENPQELEPFSESTSSPGEFISALVEICREKDACIISGIAESDHGELYNTAVAVTRDGILALYRKAHLYNTEKGLFSPGNTGFQTFNYKGVPIGMMICFDWVFPEAARTLAMKGAQIIAHPANLVLPYCQSAMKTRSIENCIFTITANRIGTERLQNETLTFTGQSQITNPKGEILVCADRDGISVLMTDIDPSLAEFKFISPRNHIFEDCRPDLYFK
jgi:predicted amidohydrolase